MTMTRERIEELKRKVAKTTNGYMMLVEPEDVDALLALAERALEPQGQALPVHMVCYQNLHGPSEAGKWREVSKEVYETFAPENRRILYASQLALPAGPAPEGDALDAQRYRKAVAHGVIVLHNGAKACVGKGEADDALDAIAPSPAVAQPVSQQFPTKPHLRGAISVLFNQEQKKFNDAQAALVGMGDSWTSWEQHFNDALADFFWPMVSAVAQPVADERAAFEAAWVEIGGMRLEDYDLDYRPDTNTYADDIEQAAWEAWQARAALCQPAEEGDKA